MKKVGGVWRILLLTSFQLSGVSDMSEEELFWNIACFQQCLKTNETEGRSECGSWYVEGGKVEEGEESRCSRERG